MEFPSYRGHTTDTITSDQSKCHEMTDAGNFFSDVTVERAPSAFASKCAVKSGRASKIF